MDFFLCKLRVSFVTMAVINLLLLLVRILCVFFLCRWVAGVLTIFSENYSIHLPRSSCSTVRTHHKSWQRAKNSNIFMILRPVKKFVKRVCWFLRVKKENSNCMRAKERAHGVREEKQHLHLYISRWVLELHVHNNNNKIFCSVDLWRKSESTKINIAFCWYWAPLFLSFILLFSFFFLIVFFCISFLEFN